MDAVITDARQIRTGDPMAARFATFGAGSRIDAPHVALMNLASVEVGERVEVRSYVNIEVLGSSDRILLRLGDGVIVGHGVRFVALNGIDVEADAGIGHGCTVADTVHDWRATPEGTHPGHTPLTLGPRLRIETGAWIGNNAVIMGGVTIGARAIVAANSVVTRSVPPDTVVAGNPAKLAGSTKMLRRFYATATSPE